MVCNKRSFEYSHRKIATELIYFELNWFSVPLFGRIDLLCHYLYLTKLIIFFLLFCMVAPQCYPKFFIKLNTFHKVI